MTFPFPFLRRALLGLWLASVLPAAPAFSADRGPLDEALRALDEGVAEVAVVKLREQLALSPDPALCREAKTKLAEALLAAGRTDEALKQAADPEVQAPLLEARIQAAAGRWEEALALYAPVASDPKSPQYLPAVLGKAESLRALGRLAEAAATLESVAANAPACVTLRLAEYRLEQEQPAACARLLSGIREPLAEPERKWKRYLDAQLLLAQNKMAQAFDQFEALQRDPRYLTHSMLVGIAIGMTKSRSELTSLTAADDILEQFLWHNPNSPSLGILFQKLDEIYGGEENPSLAELQGLVRRTDKPLRAGYAAYYLAKAYGRDAKPEHALEALENFPTRFPGHPLLAPALLMEGRLLAASGKTGAAQKALEDALRAATSPGLRGEIALASAAVHFQTGDYVLAATVYRGAGEQTPAFAEIAQFNIALCWLHQGNYARFAQEYADFSRRFPQSPLRPDLALEEGLLRAR
ncbi:MAG: tetratricopeptide repeat protein, partial [Chthoniobacteraceae bacterium]|nr:tetratricopeptide repeat protein [Chthoniobacteraceae bacterium]